MHSYNERRETAGHPSVQTKNVGTRGRAGRRRLRACAALCLSLLALSGVTAGGFAGAEKKNNKPAPKAPRHEAPRQPAGNPRTAPTPAPAQNKPLEINVTKPLDRPQEFPLGEGGPPKAVEVNFVGNRQDWSLIRFDKLPVGVQLKVSGKPDGYQESEPLAAEHYYPFKKWLPVVLEIRPEALTPVELAYWMGRGNNDLDQKYLRTFTRTEDVRHFVESNPIQSVTNRQLLKFSWSAPADGGSVQPGAQSQSQASATAPDPQASPLSTQTADQRPESSWYAYFFEDYPVLGPFLVIVFLVGAILFVIFVLPWIIALIRDTGWFRRGDPYHRPQKLKPSKKAVPSISPATGGDPYDYSLGGEAGAQAEQETVTTTETTQKQNYSTFRPPPKIYQRGARSQGMQNETQEQRPAQSQDGQSYEPSPRAMQTASLPGADRARLNELEVKVQQLEGRLGQKADVGTELSGAALAEVENMLSGAEGRIRRELGQEVQKLRSSEVEPLSKLVADQAQYIEKRFKKTDDRFKETDDLAVKAMEGADNVSRQFEEMARELAKAEERFRERLDKLRAVAERQVVPDSFYAKVLGAVLGENVEALRDGNFNQQVVERLNQFFETGVGRGEGLQGLRDRGERINAALKEVLGRMEAEGRNPEAAREAQNHAARFSSLVGELASLQAQLATRRATVETTLRVPVSLHAGARQTFLDELGRGIRREVDKLSQPEVYFEGEMERLITADLIAVVDNCDKKIGLPPLSPAGLEDALGRLFEAAGLRPILPRQGEPFKAAEQDLVEMAQGSGPSLTVERVVTRGFYYGQGESKTLLRKAGVIVYR